MADIAEKHKKEKKYDYLVTDYICPTPKTRELFKADYTIWMNTIDKCDFDDTNKMFVIPETYDFKVTTKNADQWAPIIKNTMLTLGKIDYELDYEE